MAGLTGLTQGTIKPQPGLDGWHLNGMKRRLTRGGGGRLGGKRAGPVRVAPTTQYVYRNHDGEVVRFTMDMEKGKTKIVLPITDDVAERLENFINSMAAGALTNADKTIPFDRWAMMAFEPLTNDKGEETHYDFDIRFFQPNQTELDVLQDDEDDEEEEEDESTAGAHEEDTEAPTARRRAKAGAR